MLCPTDNNNSRVGYCVDLFYQSDVLSYFAGFWNFEKGSPIVHIHNVVSYGFVHCALLLFQHCYGTVLSVVNDRLAGCNLMLSTRIDRESWIVAS